MTQPPNGYRPPDEGRRHWQRPSDEVIFRGLTGKPAPRVQDTGVRSLRSLIRKLGGTKQAAQQFGVSQRTVQRWVTKSPSARAKPSAASQRHITTVARAERDRELRTAAGNRHARRMASQPRRLYVRGVGGPTGYENEKPRGYTYVDLDPDQVDALYEAVRNDDEERLYELVDNYFGELYMGGAPTGDGMEGTWGWSQIDGFDLH